MKVMLPMKQTPKTTDKILAESPQLPSELSIVVVLVLTNTISPFCSYSSIAAASVSVIVLYIVSVIVEYTMIVSIRVSVPVNV
jgi:hypothetical protein